MKSDAFVLVPMHSPVVQSCLHTYQPMSTSMHHYAQAHVHVYSHVHAHICTSQCTNSSTCTHAHMYTHTQTHAHAHVYACNSTHAYAHMTWTQGRKMRCSIHNSNSSVGSTSPWVDMYVNTSRKFWIRCWKTGRQMYSILQF